MRGAIRISIRLFSARRYDRAFDRLLRWRFMLASQQFGLAFALAALTMLALKDGIQ